MPDHSQPKNPGAGVEFFKLIKSARDPKRAERSAGGLIPGRAMRHCDALTSATGYGYWLFPPLDIQLLWDGEQIYWAYDDAAAWLPLTDASTGAVQFPGFEAEFDELAPEGLRGMAPPLLTALPETGGVQIWTGLLARSQPGWSLNIRAPVNLPAIAGLTAWEGIVETDHWFGPVFSNFRITRTDFPVRLRRNVPFLQAQPLPQIAYADHTINNFSVYTSSDLGQSDWQAFEDVLTPSAEKIDHQGTYAVRARKRRVCPMHQQLQKSVIED